MKQRTLFTLFLAAALATPVAFAQDANTGDADQAQPVPTQADASAQQSATTDDSAASSDQGKTSGDASGMATAASTTQPYDSSATPTDQQGQEGQGDQDDQPAQQP